MSHEPIILDLPAPISTNKTRRIDWSSFAAHRTWKKLADGIVLTQWRALKNARIAGQFELMITLSEAHTSIDLDNIKVIPDYLKRIGIISDDGKKYMRRLVVEWGQAESGCRVTLRGLN